ncbi:MAG TPA: SRPBCC domain-containing protein [Anaerolineales bacterium]
MKVVTHSTSIAAPVEKVFNAYVNHIDEWWLRKGAKYRYSFAPKEVEPKHIQFEAKLGGRLYETFADGNQYVIGKITEWAPSSKLAYTWRDPSWKTETLIEIRFEQVGEQTMLHLRHSGFEAAGLPGEEVGGYQEGSLELYNAFKAWMEQKNPRAVKP